MKELLKITFVQPDIIWEDRDSNLKHLENSYFSDLESTHILILPEMFNTGFSMNANNISESMNGPTVNWLLLWAQKLNCTIVGSIAVKDGGNYFNRLIWCEPNGELFLYDKKHLFTLSSEDEYYTSGKKRLVINKESWKILPLICYDLRFPEWSRNTEEFDMLIYIASWPDTRIDHWDTLLKARAIENQCYVVGVNRVGVDGNGLAYNGHSVVIDYSGQILAKAGDSEELYTSELSKASLVKYRKALNFLKDQELSVMN
jgi:predicted amidohydrolase